MKKFVAVIVELIPVVSAILTFALIFLPLGNASIKQITTVTMLLALFGFVFFFVGRMIDREDKTVKILGILDLLATLSVIGFYVLVFVALGS